MASTAALCAAVLLAVAGCGSDEGTEEPRAPSDPDAVVDISGTEAVGPVTAGSVALLADCGDWNGATEAERLATIEDVRSQLSRPDSGVTGPELTDAEATEVFDTSCEPKWAEGFRLYKLYARSVGFATLKRELED